MDVLYVYATLRRAIKYKYIHTRNDMYIPCAIARVKSG